ncbi:hypothetical protein Lesp02_46230 [Lentzea sp. NBRC 105346]|uniref:hypothetical protein n=1 Tax=Lentzea sp. NBRC 105346 TaxID=3032205 RepID=UPI0024A1E2C8|nr:hypothetical protein [Lentzea sp. NBRC 105346]GLZ32435.1 hypothetical protein Lesp02_46230 [Lentzea sp. NBRC 105346]
MTVEQDVRDRLTCVRNLLDSGQPLDGVRIRCCAELLRTAVERAVMLTCGSVRPVHALLLQLPRYVDADTAVDVSQLWHALGRATRQHGYEVTPTPDELRGWHADVTAVTTVLLSTFTLSGIIDLS